MKENQKIGIFESVALFSGILSLCMMALPAYWETGKDSFCRCCYSGSHLLYKKIV